MSDYHSFFKGKRVTVMGLGLLGRGLGDAIFLAECGAELTVTDLRDEKTLAPSVSKLSALGGSASGGQNFKISKPIQFVLGKHRLEDFRNRDFILKAAGVSLDSPYIAEARKQGIPIEMDASLFAKLMPKGVTIVGVTGTRGKSTVTALIYEILSFATRYTLHATRAKVFRGGNLVSEATLPLLKKVRSGDIVVLELDSWQLQGFHDAKLSPQVAVFTTFLDDHLVYYQGDRERYFEDKVAIFRYQKPDDILIAGERVAKLISSRRFNLKSGKRLNLNGGEGSTLNLGKGRTLRVAKASDIPSGWKTPLLGEHNLENIACALNVAKHFKIPINVVRKAVEHFKGVPGRLEYLRTVRGVKIYNDNNATTPDATLAALRALGDSRNKIKDSGTHASSILNHESDKHIVLIMGGTDKGLDMSKLVEEIPKHCKAAVFLKESGTEKLLVTYNVKREAPEKDSRKTLHATRYTLKNTPIYALGTLKNCVKQAMSIAKRGDTVLFSPAFASFGRWFRNEYDRGQQFVDIVKKSGPPHSVHPHTKL
ncbi:MAG: UDP-N-acetylmuramoylalanine--D-glutamate ligase [Parcubacteria group bacterium Greene0416_79]|nr:MAG: UDP-N-acetylmuramoylalanine--D-glutamate ligase [Parcubacteria group bacterium Greene0416_79]